MNAGNRVRSRLVVLADTPNLLNSTRNCFGDEFRPDYLELLTILKSRSDEVLPFALANDGFPKHYLNRLKTVGYEVLLSEGRDCDFRFVEQAIALHRHGEIFALCSGDGRFAELTLDLRALGKYVIVSALRASCSASLLHSADEFFPFPVLHIPRMPRARSRPDLTTFPTQPARLVDVA